MSFQPQSWEFGNSSSETGSSSTPAYRTFVTQDDINRFNDPIYGEPFPHFTNRVESQTPHEPQIQTAQKHAVIDAGVLTTSITEDNSGLGRGRVVNNQDVRMNLNPECEWQITAGVLVNGGLGFTLYQTGIICSYHYNYSLITSDALESLGWGVIPLKTKTIFNPRGGRFQPLGAARLYVKFVEDNKIEIDPQTGFFINFLVIGMRSEQTGFHFLIGGDYALKRIFGGDHAVSRTSTVSLNAPEGMEC